MSSLGKIDEPFISHRSADHCADRGSMIRSVWWIARNAQDAIKGDRQEINDRRALEDGFVSTDGLTTRPDRML
jgi:ribonuclease BN (tRNA processing enzyme)